MAEQLDIFSGSDNVVPSKARQCVPFGKYKNQPVEVILGDPEYALYLMDSMLDRLQHKYPEFLAFLVSKFGASDRTPAHNRLQNRFLDESFALRFALACCPKLREYADSLTTIDVPAAWSRFVRDAFVESTKEPVLTETQRKYSRLPPVRDRLVKTRESLAYAAGRIDFPELSGNLDGNLLRDPFGVYGMEFEHEGADVAYRVNGGYSVAITLRLEDPFCREDRQVSLMGRHVDEKLRVEVKPLVGDDYPAILRSMKAVKDRQLLVGRYEGAGASWAEVVRVFSLSGIRAVLLEDVGQEQVPACLVGGVPIIPLTTSQAVALLDSIYAEFLSALTE